MKIRNENYKICKVFSSVSTNNEWNFEDGIIFTPQGIVHVYSQGDKEKNHKQSTFLRMIYKGRMYLQRRKKRYSKRGLAIIAGKFAREVCK